MSCFIVGTFLKAHLITARHSLHHLRKPISRLYGMGGFKAKAVLAVPTVWCVVCCVCTHVIYLQSQDEVFNILFVTNQNNQYVVFCNSCAGSLRKKQMSISVLQQASLNVPCTVV